MGLDSYLYKRARLNGKKDIKKKMALKLCGEDKDKEVAYWRKDYALNSAFLSFDKGERLDLNCEEVPITEEELKMIN